MRVKFDFKDNEEEQQDSSVDPSILQVRQMEKEHETNKNQALSRTKTREECHVVDNDYQPYRLIIV